MKNVFEVILMMWLSLTILFCLVVFSEEVFIRQQTIHIRNKVNEIVEINSGYTEDAKLEIEEFLTKIKYESEVEVSKVGKLDYGERLDYRVIIKHDRILPFFSESQKLEFAISGEFYNINY